LIAVDTNLLVYAHRADSPFHPAAEACMVSLAESAANWAIPWPCLHEFLAIVTHPRIYAPPTPVAKALDQVDAWLASPTLRLLSEAEEHWPVLRRFVGGAQIAGPKVHDARIAAVCKEHGVRELWSADRDFTRFPELRVVNPLVHAPR
jgi:toxin-antitoxin system PIN domain toxin